MSTKVIRQSRVVGPEQLHTGAVEHEVVGPGLVAVEEEILYMRRAVAEAENEVRVTEMRVIAHDMPHERPVPDHRHRLGRIGDPIAHPHSQATAEKKSTTFIIHTPQKRFRARELGTRAFPPMIQCRLELAEK